MILLRSLVTIFAILCILTVYSFFGDSTTSSEGNLQIKKVANITQSSNPLSLPPHDNLSISTTSFNNATSLLPELAEWELQALIALQDTFKNLTKAEAKASCRPPPGIPRQCCPGGAGRDKLHRLECKGKTLRHYTQLRQQVLQEVGFTEECNICRIVELLYLHNLTFGIYGDSLTGQFMDAFECSLWNQGYHVQVTQRDLYAHYRITSPQHSVELRFYLRYKIPVNVSALDFPGQDGVNAVLMAWGLHWSLFHKRASFQPQDYAHRLQRLWNHLSTQTQLRLLLYRETSAQHFDGEAGDYWSARNRSAVGTCVPLSHGTVWREELVQQQARQAGLEVEHANNLSSSVGQKVIILPFYHTTAPLYDLHPWLPTNFWERDCTHYCSVPYLWWPLWHYWRLVLERLNMPGAE